MVESLPRSSCPREFRRCATVCQSPSDSFETSPTGLGTGFGLHVNKPRRRRFPTVAVIVGGLDDQWVADLVEVQPLAKYNRGIRYLLTVLDNREKKLHRFTTYKYKYRVSLQQINLITILTKTRKKKEKKSRWHILCGNILRG